MMPWSTPGRNKEEQLGFLVVVVPKKRYLVSSLICLTTRAVKSCQRHREKAPPWAFVLPVWKNIMVHCCSVKSKAIKELRRSFAWYRNRCDACKMRPSSVSWNLRRRRENLWTWWMKRTRFWLGSKVSWRFGSNRNGTWQRLRMRAWKSVWRSSAWSRTTCSNRSPCSWKRGKSWNVSSAKSAPEAKLRHRRRRLAHPWALKASIWNAWPSWMHSWKTEFRRTWMAICTRRFFCTRTARNLLCLKVSGVAQAVKTCFDRFASIRLAMQPPARQCHPDGFHPRDDVGKKTQGEMSPAMQTSWLCLCRMT